MIAGIEEEGSVVGCLADEPLGKDWGIYARGPDRPRWGTQDGPSRSPPPDRDSGSWGGVHTEETRIERDKCTPMFIAALFIIARTWKQPRCPSADEWIRKLWKFLNPGKTIRVIRQPSVTSQVS